MLKMLLSLLLLILLLSIASCNSLSLKKLSLKSMLNPIYHNNNENMNKDSKSNNKRIASMICSSLVTMSLPIFTTINMNIPIVAYAADGKEDKTFELCISKCIFQETKPPPIGASTERLEVTKTRGEIVRECRVKCAKNKEQLLIGKPKIKSENQLKTQN